MIKAWINIFEEDFGPKFHFCKNSMKNVQQVLTVAASLCPDWKKLAQGITNSLQGCIKYIIPLALAKKLRKVTSAVKFTTHFFIKLDDKGQRMLEHQIHVFHFSRWGYFWVGFEIRSDAFDLAFFFLLHLRMVVVSFRICKQIGVKNFSRG